MNTETVMRDAVVEAVIAAGAELAHRPPKLEELAERVADRLRLDTYPSAPALDPMTSPAVRCYDLRHEQDYVYPQGKRKAKLVGGRVVKRDPKTITTIVLHQVAAEFGVSSHQLRASGGDRDLALARRALDVSCHAMAFRSGFYVLTHPILDYVQHGNGFNRYSLGLEVDGRYPGLDDDPETMPREDLRSTWGGTPSELTDRTIRAARAALGRLVTEARALGCPITTIVAHRQSSATRRSDPGQSLWRELVLEYAEPELGLRSDPSAVLGDGAPVPPEWDPRRGVGRY